MPLDLDNMITYYSRFGKSMAKEIIRRYIKNNNLKKATNVFEGAGDSDTDILNQCLIFLESKLDFTVKEQIIVKNINTETTKEEEEAEAEAEHTFDFDVSVLKQEEYIKFESEKPCAAVGRIKHVRY